MDDCTISYNLRLVTEEIIAQYQLYVYCTKGAGCPGRATEQHPKMDSSSVIHPTDRLDRPHVLRRYNLRGPRLASRR